MTGRVQGVGFRYFAATKAEELNLKGYVTNLHNGKVQIEAEGDNVDVETFIDYCRIGPARASVVSIAVHSQPIVGYTEFNMR